MVHRTPCSTQRLTHGQGEGSRLGTVKLAKCCPRVRALPNLLIVWAGGMVLAGCHPIANETETRLTASGELVALSGGGAGAANACHICHGLQGQGDGDTVPRLAGLDAGYLQKQMQDYASDLRHDDVMTFIAGRLSDDDRRAVAQWYAAMPAPGSATDATPAPALYAQGDASRGIIACAACHGDEGQGKGAGNPALAGQPAAYTVEQLRRWQRAHRRNDPRGVMTAAAAGLSDAEMSEIAAWLARRSPSRPPDSDGPDASVLASAAAEPAASRGIRRPDRRPGV